MSESEERVEAKKPCRGLKILCAALALLAAFVLGWRAMPAVWPGIRGLLRGESQATPAPTPEPYVPRSTAAFEDPVGREDSLIYYFYKDYCPYCKALEPLLAGLPASVTLPDGTASPVRMVCLNKVEEDAAAVIAAYYEDHAIPEERRYVPAIVIGDRYLFTGDEITPALLEALVAGEGLQTPLLNGGVRRE